MVAVAHVVLGPDPVDQIGGSSVPRIRAIHTNSDRPRVESGGRKQSSKPCAFSSSVVPTIDATAIACTPMAWRSAPSSKLAGEPGEVAVPAGARRRRRRQPATRRRRASRA